MGLLRKEVIIVVVLFSAGIFISKKMKGPSEEDLVRAAIEKIEAAIAYDEQLKPFQVTGRVNTLEDAIVFGLQAKLIDGDKERAYNNRDHIRANALPAALYFSSIKIDRGVTAITVIGKQANAIFRVTVTGTRGTEQAFKELISVEAKFSKEAEGRDEWLLTAATLERQTPL